MFGLSVCLPTTFWPVQRVLGVFKVSLSLMKMDLVIKLTFLRPPFESDLLEAQKACFLVTWMRVKLSF